MIISLESSADFQEGCAIRLCVALATSRKAGRSNVETDVNQPFCLSKLTSRIRIELVVRPRLLKANIIGKRDLGWLQNFDDIGAVNCVDPSVIRT